MRVCDFCKAKIPATVDCYRDHAKRLICKACYRAWQGARRG